MEAANVEWPGDIDGHSLIPLLTGEKERVREIGLYGWHGDTVNITDGCYTLFLHHPDRHPGRSRMFDLHRDPRQRKDILPQTMELAKEFQAYALSTLERMGAGEVTLETVRQSLKR